MHAPDSKQEILKVWLEGEEPNFSLQPVFDDPAVWGLVFVDIVRLLGQAYAENGRDSVETMSRIRDGFIAEFDSPTV